MRRLFLPVVLVVTGCAAAARSAHETTTAYRDRPIGGGEIAIVIDEGWADGNTPTLVDHVQYALADLPRHLRNASNLDAGRFRTTDTIRAERRLPLRGGGMTARLPTDRTAVELEGVPPPFVMFLHRLDVKRPKQNLRAVVEWSIWDNRAGALVSYGRTHLEDDSPDVRDAAAAVVNAMAREMIKGGPFFPGARM